MYIRKFFAKTSSGDCMIKIAMFDSKPYDTESFEEIKIVEEALTEALTWESQNILINNYLVRQIFADDVARVKDIVASFTPEERTEFENAMMVGLSTDTLDSIVSIFNMNVNFGK